MNEVFAAHDWPTNGALIADVARLGYISGRVMDATYGRGNFWTEFRPFALVGHDLNTLDDVDFRNLPEPDGYYDTVIYDPPYKLSGTPALGDFDNAYGIDVGQRWQDRMQMILDGLVECARVLRTGGHLLVKCQDQVCSGAVRWQTDECSRVAVEIGLVKADRFEFLRKGRPQPPGTSQAHARRNYSTLLVFKKAA